MKNYDYNGILEAISKASPSHLALVSFVVFPIVLDYWLQAILNIFPEITSCWKFIAFILLVLIYLGCLIWMAIESSRNKNLEIKRDLILGKLATNEWNDMGFDSAKKVLGEDCTDEKIHEVIQSFPLVLRLVQLRKKGKVGNIQKDDTGKTLYKSGVGLVKIESV
jgi:hypothetical protein